MRNHARAPNLCVRGTRAARSLVFSFMASRRGLSLRSLPGLAMLCLGCLPDPPAYDACSEDESNYFVVPPKGCNGHELVTLSELSFTDPTRSFAMLDHTAAFYVRSTIEIDEDYVYWIAPGNLTMRTAKSGKDQLVLHAATWTSAGILGIDQSRRRLYVGEITSSSESGLISPRLGSRILEFDLDSPALGDRQATSTDDALPSYAKVLAEFTDVLFLRAAVHGDRVYLLEAHGGAKVYAAALDPSRVARDSDLEIVVDEPVHDFGITANSELVFLRAASGMARLNLDTGVTDELLTPEASSAWGSRPYTDHDLVLIPFCQRSLCTWVSINPDGTRTALAEGIASFQGAETPVVADDQGIYAIGDTHAGASRLLDFSSSSSFPTLMVASLQPVHTLLNLDEHYVFVRTEDVSLAYESRFTTRLLRVGR